MSGIFELVDQREGFDVVRVSRMAPVVLEKFRGLCYAASVGHGYPAGTVYLTSRGELTVGCGDCWSRSLPGVHEFIDAWVTAGRQIPSFSLDTESTPVTITGTG